MLRRASRGSGAASTVGSFAFCQAGQLQYQLPKAAHRSPRGIAGSFWVSRQPFIDKVT